MNKTSRAFSPAGISSFFEVCDRTADGKPIANLEQVGARGGGFGIEKGVSTEVSVATAKRNSVKVFINGKLWPKAETTKTVVQMLLEKTNEKCSVVVRHNVEIPIGAGFGSSAAGALTAALAFSKALGLNLTYNQLGRIAHVAEVKCKTGLGTVGPLMLGGCALTIEPGAPGIAIIDRIPTSTNCVIVAGVLEAVPTREVLSSPEKRLVVNRWGAKTLEKILSEPSLENFLNCCREFAEKTGFMTDHVRTLIRLAEKAGAVGAAQNMVGEAVHALTTLEDAENVVQAFKQVLPEDKILMARVDTQGARLLG
ncbi:MAG: pantoate kinase [Candidatus Bathycorpusculaceae bacterium]